MGNKIKYPYIKQVEKPMYEKITRQTPGNEVVLPLHDFVVSS